jgi:hypothetical protein
MTNEETFELLKSTAIKNCEDYVNAIKDFSYKDISDFTKRLSLLDAYNKAVQNNASYRRFIMDLLKPLVPTNI